MRIPVLAVVFSLLASNAPAQDTNFIFTPVEQDGIIEWDKFPEFSLPFTIVYAGPHLGDSTLAPLRHGFSHIDCGATPVPESLEIHERARLWAGIVYADGRGRGQPWREIRSPWGNDLKVAYRPAWRNRFKHYASFFPDAQSDSVYDVGLICIDIESHLREGDILGIRGNPLVPDSIRALPDGEFIRLYKKEMTGLYDQALRHAHGFSPPSARVTSYADVPIPGTWWAIDDYTWRDWTTDPAHVNYLVLNWDADVFEYGDFYNHLNLLAPTAYYFYDYPSPHAPDYLAYSLFQIEVNRAWSIKPLILFEWLHYHGSSDAAGEFIRPWMAEASAIFPFFSGADGIWLFDKRYSRPDTTNFAIYEHFIYGLYRLSRFRFMFEGDYRLHIPTPARDLMVENLPVWRGVVSGDSILIAAHNPYAAEDDTTEIELSYRDWSDTIHLLGKEIYLELHSMSSGP